METRVDYVEWGTLDGGVFTADPSLRTRLQMGYGPATYYASTFFRDTPNGRTVAWGWAPEKDGDENAEARRWQGVMALPRSFLFTAQRCACTGTSWWTRR